MSTWAFTHHWYKSIFTLISFHIYSWLVNKWYQRFLYVCGQLLHRLTLFLGVFATAGNSIMTSFKLLELQIFKPGFFTDMSKDHTSGALIYGPELVIIMMALHNWKTKWFINPLVRCVRHRPILAHRAWRSLYQGRLVACHHGG